MIQMYIAGEEVVCSNLVEITEEMLSTSSTILNNCYPKSWETAHDYSSSFYYPQDYSLCTIYKDSTLIFAGVVKNSGDISLNPRDPHYCSLQILDFKTFLSEGETLDFVIANKTIKQAIEQVVNYISDYGFQVGNIQILNPDDLIGAYSTLNKSPYDVLQYLADISESRWTTRMISSTMVAIDFYDPTLMPTGTQLEYTTDFWNANNIVDMSFSIGTRDYRNKQVITSDTVYGSIDYTETILASGYTRTFATQSAIGTIKSITLNGAAQTFATNNEKDSGITANFYYTAGNATFDSSSDESIISTGGVIIIKYTPIVKGRQMVYNNTEVTRIKNQIGRKGIVARYETRNDSLSSTELNAIAQTYIKYKGNAEITLKITTQNNMYSVGQSVYFNAPITELKMAYMVKKKTTSIYANTNSIFYEYELSSSFNSETAINYFDNQRNKANGNISEGEYITRNVDIENTANIIFNNVTYTAITATGNNELNCTLNSPFLL